MARAGDVTPPLDFGVRCRPFGAGQGRDDRYDDPEPLNQIRKAVTR